VRNATAVCYPASAVGGALAVYRGNTGFVHPVQAGTALVLDADNCYHHSEQARPAAAAGQPPRALPVPSLPDGCGLRAEVGPTGTVWRVVSAEDETVATFPQQDLRISLSCKFHVFRDAEEEADYTAGSDALTAEQMIEEMRADLARRNIAGTEPGVPLHQLGPLLVKHYTLPLAPPPSLVRDVWSNHHHLPTA